jgi:hypothetical protein
MSDEDLRRPVTPEWSVAVVLGLMAFWDARAFVLGKKVERGVPFSPDDNEPEDVDWINGAARPLIEAIEPRAVVELVLRQAEETDALMAALPPERLYPQDEESPVYALRADHRGEHLDQIEKAIGGV